MTASTQAIAENLGGDPGHRIVETPVTLLASGQRLTVTSHLVR
jgi:hypothetical protein